MVNLQSNDEFASHQLNRDTWSNPTVKSTIQNSFIFWQASLRSSWAICCEDLFLVKLLAFAGIHSQSLCASTSLLRRAYSTICRQQCHLRL